MHAGTLPSPFNQLLLPLALPLAELGLWVFSLVRKDKLKVVEGRKGAKKRLRLAVCGLAIIMFGFLGVVDSG